MFIGNSWLHNHYGAQLTSWCPIMDARPGARFELEGRLLRAMFARFEPFPYVQEALECLDRRLPVAGDSVGLARAALDAAVCHIEELAQSDDPPDFEAPLKLFDLVEAVALALDVGIDVSNALDRALRHAAILACATCQVSHLADGLKRGNNDALRSIFAAVKTASRQTA